MSRAQIDACAERITDDEQRLQFLALMAASAALFGQAVLLRRQAWDIYRDATGTVKQAATKKKAKK
ncbi:MAG: hypothetical protein IPO59_19810 [Betaproteobacteria bacterium]|mgnify:CR=1 FL=1|nr:hypothetical protein [Betaproteobacteria bacterium]